ncbi:MAG TPA: DcaP family trimeric outer membrane transporter [Verrucomicrobiae bacterium]|nr:DcaP family trimeric outer membrane transporter [Verrucomicrobiae bacterium]
MSSSRCFALAALFAVSAPALAQREVKTIPVNVDDPQPAIVGDVDITYGGFVKLDAMFSVYSDGDVATPGGLRDFYNPAAIPVAASESAENQFSTFDMHAKETRLFFKIDAHVADATLGGYIEMDFLVNPGAGTEVVTNAYNPGLRRAFITYNNFVIGQEWTNFVGLQSLPEAVDFIRWPTDGTVFGRQPQVRYTLNDLLGGSLSIALENTETLLRPTAGTVSGATPVTANFVSGDGNLPDLTARYAVKLSFGEFSAAVLARELRADLAATGGDAPNNTASGKATGLGVSLAGKVATFGKDDVRFQLTAGEGIGRYVALGAAADAVVAADGSLDTIPLAAGFLAYRHVWSERWRSNLVVSTFQADNDTTLTGGGATHSMQTGRINLMYAPVDKLTFGVEFTHGTRELENGQDGTLDRVHFATTYAY